MIDPFARAKAMHAGLPAIGKPAMPQAATAPPMAAQPTLAQKVQPQMNFLELSKSMGLGHLKLDKNPVQARTQLMQHLQKHFGNDYMANPQVSKLLEAFNQHATGTSASPNMVDSGTAGTLKALMGSQ